MATKTWFVTNNVLDSVHQEMSETSPGSEATSSPNYGWTVPIAGTPPLYSKADAGVERANTTFAATPVEPDGSIDTSLGDCWRTTGKLTGTFATGNWTFQMRVIAVSGGGSQDGRAAFRLFRGPNADGSGATEITSGRLVGGTVTDLTTSTAQTSAHSSTSIGSFSLNDEYLFVQVGWEATGLGAHGSPDVIARIGTASSLVTSTDFVENTIVTPTTASLATALFAAAVIIGTIVTPTTAALTLAGFAPTVTVAAGGTTVTPGTAALTLATFAPTVLTPQLATPAAASLVLTALAPSVTATNHQLVVPSTASLTLAPFAPTALAPRLAVPATAALTLATFAPTVTGGTGTTIVPGVAALTLSAFAPTVLAPQVFVPGVASLTLQGLAPDVSLGNVPPPPPRDALGPFTRERLDRYRRDWVRP